MTPWTYLDTAPIPGSTQKLRLVRRDDEFAIYVGPIGLMTDQDRGSERALATLTCDRLRDRPRPKILIGGLGMGFTLRAALGALGPEAEVVVAELIPAVAEWARGPIAHHFAGSLDDPRVELRIEDVNRTIQSGRAQFDAILLDVDNGPEGLTHRSNNRLYDRWGLGRARFALRPGGILAVWSSAPNRKFKARLQLCGFDVDEQRVPAGGNSGRRHVLWLARRPSDPASW